MAQYVYTMNGVGKIVPPKRQILKDIYLSFFPGAKIGVLGLNGAGKSTLLKIMAGLDTDIIGEAFPMPDIKIGYLPQEPQLDSDKDVRGNVEEGLQIAGIINDKGLDTYVAKNSIFGKGNCASACSFMFFAGIIMASTNLLFSILAWSDKSELLFAIAVIFDDIAAAFATVAFVAFISLLVDRTYTATQYALLASIGTAGRTTLASSSGALVDWLNGDWGLFFILTALMVIPSLVILWSMKSKLKLSEK